jgi:hypothetical protein
MWVLCISEVEVYRLEGNVHGGRSVGCQSMTSVEVQWRLGQMCGEELN